MQKLIRNLFDTFFTRTFILFGILGVINTVIHILFYSLFNGLIHHTVSNLLAFLIASLFSYFANSYITYQKKTNNKTFVLSLMVFGLKLLISTLLEMLIYRILTNQDITPSLINIVTPLVITSLITPLQFLVFNRIFIQSFLIKEVVVEGTYEEI